MLHYTSTAAQCTCRCSISMFSISEFKLLKFRGDSPVCYKLLTSTYTAQLCIQHTALTLHACNTDTATATAAAATSAVTASSGMSTSNSSNSTAAGCAVAAVDKAQRSAGSQRARDSSTDTEATDDADIEHTVARKKGRRSVNSSSKGSHTTLLLCSTLLVVELPSAVAVRLNRT
jgi:hypothetical protein